MVRIAVVGLGQMGLSALRILHAQRPDAEFVAVDRSAHAVEVASRLGDNVGGWVTDVATEPLDLAEIDIVLNLAGPFFAGSDAVARAALRAGSTYVDIGDDVEATETILALDGQARRAGVALVTGAGLSPGVSNWMAARLLDHHPDADGVQIAWATHESDPGGLAPLRHMLHMAVNPCPVFVDGVWRQSPGFVPSTGATFQFPQPLGEVEAFDTAHPEPITLARHYPRLRNAGCKGALLPQWANSAFSTLGRIGFGYSDVPVEVNGVTIEPAEFLWRLMWARYNRKEARERTATTSVLVQALQGQHVLETLAIIDDAVMARGTGLGAAVAVLAALDLRPESGAWGAEALPWQTTLPLFVKLAEENHGFPAGLVDPASSNPDAARPTKAATGAQS